MKSSLVMADLDVGRSRYVRASRGKDSQFDRVEMLFGCLHPFWERGVDKHCWIQLCACAFVQRPLG